MNFCNVRNSSGGSTEQMETQLPLMPSSVILLQFFIVEGFFCLFGKVTLAREERGRGGEAAFLLISDTDRYIKQQHVSGLSKSPKVETAQGVTVTTKIFARDHLDKELPQMGNGIYHMTIKKERKVLMCWNGARRRSRRGEHVREAQRTFMEWGSKKRRTWRKMQIKHTPLTVSFRSTYTRNIQVTYYQSLAATV